VQVKVLEEKGATLEDKQKTLEVRRQLSTATHPNTRPTPVDAHGRSSMTRMTTSRRAWPPSPPSSPPWRSGALSAACVESRVGTG
jgi:hypothetical protein